MVKLITIKRVPALIASGVILLVCLLQLLPHLWPIDRLEWMAYDVQMLLATRFVPSVASTNLAAVFIDDDSIAVVSDGTRGFQYGLYWPRHLYGRIVRELTVQGAKFVGFDIIFGELRPDHRLVVINGATLEPDQFFAQQMRRAGNVALAAKPDVVPAEMFRTNAMRMGDITAESDSDGILRRTKPFVDYRIWHPLILRALRLHKMKLESVQIDPTGLRLEGKSASESPLRIELDSEGCFDCKFVTENKNLLDEEYVELGPRRARAFIDQRGWAMGIIMAARELNLDLDRASVEPQNHRIRLPGPNGIERVIPIDDEGRFYIDWCLPPWDKRLTKDSFEHVLALDLMREVGDTNEIPRLFQNKLVVVGSIATGNDLTDLVTTPLGKKTYGVSQHWNVANTIITGRFIRPYSHPLALCLIVLLGATSALLTWNLRVLSASFWVVTLVVVYLGLTAFLFTQYRVCIPLVLPMLGALLTTYVCLVTYQAFFEQKERRRVKSVFAKLVSPNVVNELLKSKQLSFGGARCEVSVYFADVRGFTELTDRSHARAEAYVREHQLTGASAKAYYDQQAQDVLQTVNLYLGAIADMVKKHNGTLDKYIGDCVMAFWGAPTPSQQHALFCVRAAIDAQRATADLNRQRFAENERREAENAARADQGQPPIQLLPLLSLGTGINTGIVTVGLMGSDAHILNYTVFGREVNLASRLEGVSGCGRIVIGEATYAELLRDDPTLAALCVSQPPVTVKGIHEAVKIYEVPWKLAEPTTVPVPAPVSPSPSSTHTA